MRPKPRQINNLTIKPPSAANPKFTVWTPDGRCLDEFSDELCAEQWCHLTRDFISVTPVDASLYKMRTSLNWADAFDQTLFTAEDKEKLAKVANRMEKGIEKLWSDIKQRRR